MHCPLFVLFHCFVHLYLPILKFWMSDHVLHSTFRILFSSILEEADFACPFFSSEERWAVLTNGIWLWQLAWVERTDNLTLSFGMEGAHPPTIP